MRKGYVLLALTLVVLSALTACGPKATPAPTPEAKAELAGKKVLMVIAHRDFRDEEYQVPRRYLEERGAEVRVASSSADTAKGMLGAQVKPDLVLEDVRVDDYDAIVFVGGTGAQEYWDNPTAHAIAREALEKGKLLAAICIAPVTLARAGLLEGKKATVFHSVAGEIKKGGANYTGKSVERDGLLITANGPQAAEAFAAEIARALAGK